MYIAFSYPQNAQKITKYFFKSSHNVPVRKTDVILYDVAARMCQFDVTLVCSNMVRSVNSSALKKNPTFVTHRRKQIGVQCKRRLEFVKVVDVIPDF